MRVRIVRHLLALAAYLPLIVPFTGAEAIGRVESRPESSTSVSLSSDGDEVCPCCQNCHTAEQDCPTHDRPSRPRCPLCPCEDEGADGICFVCAKFVPAIVTVDCLADNHFAFLMVEPGRGCPTPSRLGLLRPPQLFA